MGGGLGGVGPIISTDWFAQFDNYGELRHWRNLFFMVTPQLDAPDDGGLKA